MHVFKHIRLKIYGTWLGKPIDNTKLKRKIIHKANLLKRVSKLQGLLSHVSYISTLIYLKIHNLFTYFKNHYGKNYPYTYQCVLSTCI